mmetsp:Transcript_18589/g.33129  ORF Transcript_18589/g.33129 Transcript_18589/m.33129 type:complete len:305 (-) Transcript_18589:23-937(-)
MRVALVVGVDADRCVAEDGLGAGGGDGDGLAVGARDGVLEIEELHRLVEKLDLQVAHRRLQVGAPVDHVAAAVDQALVVQPRESLHHRGAQLVVQREGLAAPVARGAQPSQLTRDRAPVLPLPLPHLFRERLAAQLTPRHALRREHLLHHHLRGDAGMVGAGQPEGGAAARAREPRHYVLQRGKHGVTHVQLPRHIGRRHAHHKRLPCRIGVRLKVPRPLPPLINFFLTCEVKVFGKLHGRTFHSPTYSRRIHLPCGRPKLPTTAVGSGRDKRDGRRVKAPRGGGLTDDSRKDRRAAQRRRRGG